MFKDIAYAYSRPRQMERDLQRLLHGVQHHGMELLAVMMPAICKHFDKCLSEGLYKPSGLAYSKQASRTIVVPAFMQDLYLQIFHKDGCLVDNPDCGVIMAIRQALKGLSKVKILCRKDRISDEVRNFYDIECSLPVPSLNWQGTDLFGSSNYYCHLDNVDFGDSQQCDPGIDSETGMYCSGPDHVSRQGLEPSVAKSLQQVADYIACSLGDFYTERCEITGEQHLPKHGPGRVSNLKRGESKYTFAEWPDKLDFAFPYEHYAIHDSGLVDSNPRVARLPGEYSSPSKLIAVPKTLKGPRLIASEPNSNQWIQQLMLKQVVSKVKVSKYLNKTINFESQAHNAWHALKASISGSDATIDLSSASDRFSLWTFERMFRRNRTLLERFHACRTQAIKNEIDSSFGVVTLKKAFSQGNALTFPIQSIGYAIICIAAVLIQRGQNVTTRNIMRAGSEVSVYGDDMIVPIDAFEMTVYLLEALGLKVNSDKTFHNGRFRESCGTDAYAGVDVTPSYVKVLHPSPDHEIAVSAIEASNNLLSNGWWHLAQFQESLITRFRNKLPVIAISEQILGLKSFSGRNISHLRKRWSPDLHRTEYQVLTLCSKVRVKDHELSTSHFYQWVVEKPSILLKWESGVVDTSSAVLRRGWNPLL
jgi:hypothetical protein